VTIGHKIGLRRLFAVIRMPLDAGRLHVLRPEIAASAPRRIGDRRSYRGLKPSREARKEEMCGNSPAVTCCGCGSVTIGCLFAIDTAEQVLWVELIRTRGDVYKR
jgi:hypothetical protein